MRVICIDDKPIDSEPCRVKEGVVYESLGISKTGKGFIIKGIHPYFDGKGFLVVGALIRRFAPLSEIDERDLAHAEPIESTFILEEV